MSDRLKCIAARYAAGLRAADSLDRVGKSQRLELLRAVMRYGLRVNHFMSSLELAAAGHGETTWDDWPRFIGPQSGGPAHDLGEFVREGGE